MKLLKKIFTLIPFFILVLIITGTSACTSTEGSQERIPVERVEILINNDTIDIGALINPNVVIYPENATDQSYTLHTYDEHILRKTDHGFIAFENGKAEIIVLAADGVTNRVEVNVINPVRLVSFDIDEISLDIGEFLRLSPNIFPKNASYSVMEFMSSNDDIATVTNAGTIRAVSLGEAIITCRVDDITATVIVKVQVLASSIIVSTDKHYYAVGDKGTITVDFVPENTTDQTFEVSFSNGAHILERNTFEVTAPGEVTITITTSNGITARHNITVVDLDAFANDVFELINRERRLENLPEFTQKKSLTRVADLRATEISDYFSHTRPDGRSWDTALNQFLVTYFTAGENIAMGQKTAAEAVADWMASPGHRNNILNGGFGSIGLGVAIDSDGTLYWAQVFTN